ncbi:hypothetical protein Taro_010233 [Colocasia esculenta]|uniref:Glucosidase 2 subunit beta n=1 Tax=Colocasia esculenta TaxID=4460 RepID=A0A843U716_COLES|nr:hypothetical protein [Colocasia esculenta]
MENGTREGLTLPHQSSKRSISSVPGLPPLLRSIAGAAHAFSLPQLTGAAPCRGTSMEASRRAVSLLVAAFFLVWIAGSAVASVPSKDALGIAPQDEDYYKASVIKCKDGSKRFTREQLNDEFCDCPDGTDEPGTSACPEGRFYCRNKGHTPISIFSSRVNDGICDCCDGSDEYDGKVKCTNTCWEAGKAAREKLKKKITMYKDGVVLRKAEVEKAKKAFEQDEAELSKLKSEEKILKGLVQKLKDHKEEIEKAEEQERLRKEKEEEKLKESVEKAEQHEKEAEILQHGTEDVHETMETLNMDAAENSDKPISEDENDPNIINEKPVSHDEEQPVEKDNLNGEDKIETTEDAQHVDASSHHAEKQEEDNTEGLSKEELGRLVASRWTGEKTTEHKKEDDKVKEASQKDDSRSAENHEEDYDGYNSESEDSQKDEDHDAVDGHTDDEYEDNIDPSDSYKHEAEDEMEDFSISSSPSWLDKIQQTVRNLLQTINLFKTPVDLSEASRIRKEYDDSSSKLSKIQSRISKLTEKLRHDFGGDREFYSFYDHCFETKQDKYVYKICPFKDASQVEGYSTTRLGSWDKFEDSYRMMQFSNGDKCWNGPDRSIKVRLRCGLKNEIIDVDEPSRCEYVAIMTTPVLCLEEKKQELQKKLELMNSGESLSHDEL